MHRMGGILSEKPTYEVHDLEQAALLPEAANRLTDVSYKNPAKMMAGCLAMCQGLIG